MSGAAPVRTPEEPMAFTRREFRRGAWSAWGAFLVLLVAVEVVVSVLDDLRYVPEPGTARLSSLSILPVVVIVSLAIAAPVAALVVVAAAPLVRRMAWRMRTRHRRREHVLAILVAGLAIGAASALVIAGSCALLLRAEIGLPALAVYTGAAALLTAPSMLFGWWRAVSA